MRVNSEFNTIKSEFDSKGKNEALQAKIEGLQAILSEEEVIHRPTKEFTQEHKAKNERTVISSTKPNSETIKMKSRRGAVQTRDCLRKCESNWLVLGAMDRWNCKEKLNPGDVCLVRNRRATTRSIPGSDSQFRNRANERILMTVNCRIIEGIIVEGFASYHKKSKYICCSCHLVRTTTN